MYSRGIPVVQAKIQNGYNIYNYAIGDTVTDMVVRWSYPEKDETITGTIVGFELGVKGSPDNHGAAVLDNIPAMGYVPDECAKIISAEEYYAVESMLVMVETPVTEGDPIVTYVRVPVGAIYSLTEEPAETILEVVGVSVVDGTDGVTPVTQPVVGQILRANIICSDTPEGEFASEGDVDCTWYYQESPDTVLGTGLSYTFTEDNVGKTVCMKATVAGYDGMVSWTADAVVAPVWPENSDVTIVI